MSYDTTPNRNLVNEVEQTYDDNFVMVYHDQLDHLFANARPTTLAVFLALLKRANRKHGDTCFPSLDTIAKDAHVSRKTVTTSIKELKALGLVSVQHRLGPDGSPTSNVYKLHRVVKDSGDGVNPIPTQGINFTPPSPQNLHPNKMNSNQKEYEQEDTPTPDVQGSAVAIVSTWAEVCNGGQWPVNRAEAMKHARKMASGGVTPDEARSLIDWMRGESFWQKAGIDLRKMAGQVDAWRASRTTTTAKRERLVF